MGGYRELQKSPYREAKKKVRPMRICQTCGGNFRPQSAGHRMFCMPCRGKQPDYVTAVHSGEKITDGGEIRWS